MTDPARQPLAFRRIALAAGGTGGHIYPALSLGRALRKADPTIELDYYCGNRDGEAAIYRDQGIDPVILPISGRRPGAVNTLIFLKELASARRAAGRRMRAWMPDLVIGFGNYLSVPVLMAARKLGVPTAIHEQNATPGYANRLLGRRADLIMAGVTLEGRFHGSVVHVGNPVREELFTAVDHKAAAEELGLPSDRLICLCFGGSQGARGINRILLAALEKIADRTADDPTRQWHFLWVTGPKQFEAIEQEIQARPALEASVTLRPYMDRMDLAYAAACLVIARAGALTIAEITALGKPSILIPLPTAAGGHQQANARRLEQAGAALVVEESNQQAAQKIVTSLEKFAVDCDRLKEMAEAARKLGAPGAAELMIEAIAKLAARRVTSE